MDYVDEKSNTIVLKDPEKVAARQQEQTAKFLKKKEK
jgi:hypothetical protein